MKNTIGICIGSKITFEVEQLIEEAKNKYGNVILIDPQLVYYKFYRDKDLPDIMYTDNNKLVNLNKLPALIVRATRYKEKAISLLVNSLALCNTFMTDPLKRFQTINSSKLLTTVERFKSKTGVDTFIAFDFNTTLKMLSDIRDSFPLIGKPSEGKRGKGINTLSTVELANKYINSFFSKRKDDDDPIFLQKFVDISYESRVFLIDGKSQASMVKQRFRKELGIKKVPKHVIKFIEDNCNNNGVLGVDVGVGVDDAIYIIEANRAPQWKFLQKRTKKNIAKLIIDRIYENSNKEEDIGI